MDVKDLVPQWKRERDSHQDQLNFFERGPGMNPPLALSIIRAWIAELDSLIAFYS
jgi:hypothetical protein